MGLKVLGLLWLEVTREGPRVDIPAVGQLVADFLEVVVPHVVDAKRKAVLILWNAFPNIGKQLILLLAGLLGHLGEVVDLGAF